MLALVSSQSEPPQASETNPSESASIGSPPTHAPPRQVSFEVHTFSSSQGVPSGLCGFEQLPVAGLQVPATWHWSSGVQTTEFGPVHKPDWQVSGWVHALLSSQAVPSVKGVLMHIHCTQLSFVQKLLSSQSSSVKHKQHEVSWISTKVSQSLSKPSQQEGSPPGPSFAPGLTSGFESSQSVPPMQASSKNVSPSESLSVWSGIQRPSMQAIV